MKREDLPSMRLLAKNRQITYSDHAIDQMFDRNISDVDVEAVLCSSSNQLIEVQPPSKTPGKQHKDERVLISDPQYDPAIIVVFALQLKPMPGLVIVTVEHVLDDSWVKSPSCDPWLKRIKK